MKKDDVDIGAALEQCGYELALLADLFGAIDPRDFELSREGQCALVMRVREAQQAALQGGEALQVQRRAA